MVRMFLLYATMLIGMNVAAAPTGARIKFLIHPRHAGMHIDPQALDAVGARSLAAYGEGRAVEVPGQAREAFLERFAAFDVRELDDIIYTPRRPIDPRREVSPPAPFETGLFVLQYVAPATPQWQTVVRASGVLEVQPLAEQAVIVAGTRDQIASLAGRPWIRWAGPYGREHKFAPAGTDRGEFVIQIADNELSAAAIDHVEGVAGGFITRSSSDGLLTARIATDRATAESFLDEPFVLGVETYVPLSPSDERQALSMTGGATLAEAVGIANSGSASGTRYRKWLNKYNFTPANLTNSNIVVDVADTGVDTGCASTVTSTRAHADLRGRIVYHNGATTGDTEVGVSRDPDYHDNLGHGTVVATIVGGNPLPGIDTSQQPTTGRGEQDSDSQGQFYWGMGVAPGIRIGSTVMMGGGQVGQVVDWTTRAVSRYCNTPANPCTPTATLCRATVQNHSNNEYEATGTNAGCYTTSAREFDKSVRRADHAANLPLAITVSAGNIGQGDTDLTTRVLAPATAKNVISVGAVESSRAAIPQTCLDDLAQGNNQQLRNTAQGYNVLAYASRRGTIDNRLKPDVLAPATLSTGGHAYYGFQYCLRGGGFDATGDPWYHGGSGTSFAAPVAAGSIALLRYFYSTNHGLVPSPAMYKAMLVAGARSLTSGTDRYTGTTITKWPNAQQGFGAIALEPLFSSVVLRGYRDQQATPLLQGQSSYFTVTVGDPTKAVRIVLAWTDKEGAVQDPTQSWTKALVNDLDLRAAWPDGLQYYGNVTNAAGYSYVPGCGRPFCPIPADVLNNVEVINIDPARFMDPTKRTFTVRVWAAVLNGAGVPGAAGGANNQDFALFVMNGSLTPQ